MVAKIMNDESQLQLKGHQLVSRLVIYCMVFLSLWCWHQIPADRGVAVHWGLSGQADGFAPKSVGLFMLPALMLLVQYIFFASLGREKHRSNLAKSQALVFLSWYGSLALIAMAHALIVFTALGYSLPVAAIITTAVGVLLLLTGMLLIAGKVHRNNSVGVRTPWNRMDDVTWSKTNRLGGWIIAAMGLASIISGLCANMYFFLASVMSGVIILLSTTWIYSYVLAKSSQIDNKGN